MVTGFYGTDQASPTGVPRYSSEAGMGYVPTHTQQGGRTFSEADNLTWRMSAAELMLSNMMNNPAAAGQPGFWNEARHGSWQAMVSQVAGAQSAPAGVGQALLNALKDYNPVSGDYLQQNVGAYVPPTGKEYVLDPAYETWLFNQQQAVKAGIQDEQSMEFKKYQFEMELALARSGGGGGGGGSGGGTIRLAGTGGGGSSSGGSGGSYNEYHSYSHADERELALQRSKIDMDWKIALLSSDTQKSMQQRALEFERLKLEADTAFRNATLELDRERLAAEKERFEKEEQMRRATIISEYSQNPNDLLAREYFLRQGVEPQGTAVDIFSGQPTAQNTTFSQAFANSADAIAPYQQQAGSAPPIPQQQAPAPAPAPAPPPQPEIAAAAGTLGYVRAKSALVGEKNPRTGGSEEVVLNPTGAPIAVVPNHALAGYFQGRMS